MSCAITQEQLSHFYGSDQLYFNGMFRGVQYTEGVIFLNHNGAGWLVDVVLSHVCHTKKVKHEEFVDVKLTMKGKKATVVFGDGNGNVLAKQVIEYTDFPLAEISFYVEGVQGHKVMMLPSER